MIQTSYKQTEIGLIPSDWEVKEMGVIANVIMGQSPLSQYYNQDGIGLPLIQGNADIKNRETIIRAYTSVITKKGEIGNIIMSVRAPVGEVSKATLTCCLGRGVCAIAYKNEFLYHYLLFYEKSWAKHSTGSTFDSVNSAQVKGLKIPIPLKAEQTAIANALSDADSYIAGLEKLIAKKHLIKQGALQQLLKPKNGWVVKKLGEIGKTFGGLSGKTKDDFQNGVYPYIPFMNIMSNPIIDITYFDYVKIGNSENQNKALKYDLFFNGSSETPEEVGMCSVLLEDIHNLYLNSFCFGFRLFNVDEMNGLFLSYYFRSNEGRKLMFSSAQGATRYNLSKANFLKLELHLPNIEEQTRIAAILNDMDKGIESVEKKLSKAQSIKQGMMQQLLTGKVRLI